MTLISAQSFVAVSVGSVMDSSPLLRLTPRLLALDGLSVINDLNGLRGINDLGGLSVIRNH